MDIPGSMAWQAIVEAARASSGSVIIPIAGDVNIIDGGNIAQAAGCDLMRHPAEVLNWLSDIAKDHPLTVGNYTYLDGEQFVRLSVCADAVMAELCRRHRETAIAFLGSPNDIHVIPVDAVKAQQDNYLLHEGRGLEKGFHNLTKGKFFVLNELPPIVAEDGRSMYFVDGALKMQGPNYL